MRKAILYGNDVVALARIAQSMRDSEYDKVGNVVGVVSDNKDYSVKFNKAGVSVWCNDDIPPHPTTSINS